MVEFVDVSIEDLVNATEFVHHLRPDFRDMMVMAIEKAQPLDQNVVFHLSSRKSDDKRLFILAAEYIVEHPYWQ
jgi:hypothetical protein